MRASTLSQRRVCLDLALSQAQRSVRARARTVFLITSAAPGLCPANFSASHACQKCTDGPPHSSPSSAKRAVRDALQRCLGAPARCASASASALISAAVSALVCSGRRRRASWYADHSAAGSTILAAVDD